MSGYESPIRGRTLGALLVLLGIFVVAAVTVPEAHAGGGPDAPPPESEPRNPAKVRVMTRNLYLGADLGPAIQAEGICDAVDAGGEILNEVDRSNFPARAKLLAREIKRANPHFIGLQEVALWRFQENADFTATPATEVRYDFLALLRKELRRRDARYEVAVVQEQFDQELPADRDGSDATQDPTFPLCGADEDGRLTMRDVILVKKDRRLSYSKRAGGNYESTYSVMLGGVVPIEVDRGWTKIEARIKGTKQRKGARFRFVNTHLEAFGDPRIREDQAKELRDGPLQTRKQLILVGDLNSGLKNPHNIGPGGGGSADPRDQLAFRVLDRFGMKDRGAVQSCCYPDVYRSEIGSYRFTHTVDHVLVKPGLRSLGAYVTGDDPSVNITDARLVASDHGGVVSELRFRR